MSAVPGTPGKQWTLAEKVSCTGIGIHSGLPVQMTLHPARAGSGITFVRTDLARPVEIPAHYGAVVSTRLATTLGRGEALVGTVEHLLAALYALGIDNVRVELSAAEVPVMDGSAAPFVHLLHSAGTFQQAARRRVLEMTEVIELSDGDRMIRIEPARELSVDYAVEFEHPAIGRQQTGKLVIDPDCFEREIAPARTFGFLRDVDMLQQAGFALGGGLQNTVVLDDTQVLNEEGLRRPDEFVRHKVLDLLGDLALLGTALRGHITVLRGGHTLHQQLVREIAQMPELWASGGLRAPRIEHSAPLPLAVPA